MDQLHEALKTYFGYDSFRGGQEAAISALLSGRDVLGVMPTGAGKSICFQLPALLLPGITLVISPLISLMKDQVTALGQAGIPAAYLNSTLSSRQFHLTLEHARLGHYKLIYVAPERLLTPLFQTFSEEVELSLVAVDEAHCVSQWGQDFRPNYMDITPFVAGLHSRPVVAAFTATATAAVRADIRALLELQDPEEIMTGFDRENLYFEVRRPKNRTEETLKLVHAAEGENGIIYCSTRKNVVAVCDALRDSGVPAVRYHAGLSTQERKENQEDFTFDRAPVIVATNAFGMGIDKSNVRYVIHYNMPKDMESYYQEAGRAGRDGDAARCILLYSPQDVIINRFLIERDEDETTRGDESLRAQLREKAYTRLSRMDAFCKSERCLRQNILQYFGQSAPDHCSACVNCVNAFEELDITIDAQKILSCVKRTGERFGITLIIEVLRGRSTQRILALKLEQQSTYGLMEDISVAQMRERISALIQRDCLVQMGDEYPVLVLGPRAAGVLFRGEKVAMRREAAERSETRQRKSASLSPATVTLLPEPSKKLFQRLRALRAVLAKEQAIPPFMIFSDATLRDMCQRCPSDEVSFLDVSGVGQRKLAQYGAAFLQELRMFLEQQDGSCGFTFNRR